jgi:hypothetical protein
MPKKEKPIGECRLCLRERELQLSHLLPRAVYDYLRQGDPGKNLPVIMTDRITVKDNEQLKDHLLCEECEDRFNKNGESYALSVMWTGERFKLLDQLNAASAIGRHGNSRFSGRDIGVDMDKLAYFALSVFWRAGAHKWKSKYTVKYNYSIDLKDYLEPIRRFLLGGSRPENVSVMITVAIDLHSRHSVYAPTRTQGVPLVGFGFLTCGIHFTLFMQKPIPPNYQRFCSVRSSGRPIFWRDLSAQTLHSVERLYKVGRVARNMKPND